MRILILATAVLLTHSAAFAQSNNVGDVGILHPWAMATTGSQQNGFVYMSLIDRGTEPDQLISASSPIARSVHLAAFDVQDGVYGIHPINAVEVMSDGAAIDLRPGGAHLILDGLKEPLQEGKAIPLSLTFQRAGTIQIKVSVERPRGTSSQAAFVDSLGPVSVHGGFQ